MRLASSVVSLMRHSVVHLSWHDFTDEVFKSINIMPNNAGYAITKDKQTHQWTVGIYQVISDVIEVNALQNTTEQIKTMLRLATIYNRRQFSTEEITIQIIWGTDKKRPIWLCVSNNKRVDSALSIYCTVHIPFIYKNIFRALIFSMSARNPDILCKNNGLAGFTISSFNATIASDRVYSLKKRIITMLAS